MHSNTGEGLAIDITSAILAPLRVGFAATNATSRKGAAAGYYGNMNLSDNVAERPVFIGNSTGRAFTGTHGDGILTTTASFEGNATNNDWPGIDATTNKGVTGATGYCLARAADVGGIVSTYTISKRGDIGYIDAGRNYNFGARFARTAP